MNAQARNITGTALLSEFPFYFTWGFQPSRELFPVERAEWDEFILRDGRRVYDFISTSFQANWGHSHPAIQRAITRQLQSMPIASPKATFDLKERVSRRLLDLLGLSAVSQGQERLFYTLSGSESVENALKMARQVSGRTVIAARRKSYHGSSLGALSVTGDWRNAPHFTVDEHTLRIPEPEEDPEFLQSADLLRSARPGAIAAVIVETVSGTNGVSIPTRTWFEALRRTCTEIGAFLIVDEVLCGFGRTGPPFAFHEYQVTPDLVCMSKGITGGYIPFGAVWTGPRVTEFYRREKLTCGLTNYAHPLGLAALDAVLEIMSDDGFRQNKAALEQVFSEWFATWSRVAGVQAVRCRGLLGAIEFEQDRLPDWQTFFHHGNHVFCTPRMLILAPPFVSKPERLRMALQAVQQSISSGS